MFQLRTKEDVKRIPVKAKDFAKFVNAKNKIYRTAHNEIYLSRTLKLSSLLNSSDRHLLANISTLRPTHDGERKTPPPPKEA
jgi:hypothetical protein